MKLEEVVQKFTQNPTMMGYGSGKLAKWLNTTTEIVKQARSIVRKGHQFGSKNIDKTISKDENFQQNKQTVEYNGIVEIKTKEDLIRECQIDENIWQIDRMIHNAWGKESNQNWQVKAWLSKKPIIESDIIKNVLDNYTTKYIPLSSKDIYVNETENNKVSVIISLADPHIDKMTTDGTTIEDKKEIYLQILQKLIVKAHINHQLEEIVYVLGNDYFTSDTYHNTTTNLTPQMVTDDHAKSYEHGFDMAVKSINILRQFTKNLKIIFVPANHDRSKSFYLLHALEIYFKNDSAISFDRTAENTKVYIYGNNFIGFHHGDTILEKLPLYFASKYRNEWGRCKFTEIILGDKHHKKQWKFTLSEQEVNSTRMCIVPSLTTPDKWHKDKNYDLAIIAGVVRLYHKTKGYCGELEERI